jgi:3-phosphoshikimate 1-carboxyvinyltransferase
VTVAPAPSVVRLAPRLRGSLWVPGDKSIAHRAHVVGALSGGPSTVSVRSPGQDVRSTVACLRDLGVAVSEEVDGPLVRFTLEGLPSRDAVLDCGNSGTTMRLLAGALAGLPLRLKLDGDTSLRSRPMERVAALLRAAGADATTTDGRPPMTIIGRERLEAVRHDLPVASAQLLGAAALAGLAAHGETVIASPGPTRDHTERILAAAGIDIRRDGLVTTLRGPARPRPLELIVPGDVSSAAPWLVAAALHPDADLTILEVGLNPTRTALVELLRDAGADVMATITDGDGPEPIGELRIRSGRDLQPIEVTGSRTAELIDELPLVGVLMAVAGGELRDASELRLKESDRIASMVAGLAAIGASVEELADGWRVAPGAPREAQVTTHGDHRIAIAFAVAALAGVASVVELDDPACVAVSYPTFWSDLAQVTA